MIEIIPNWHPMLVHFTIALLATATGFYLLSLLLPASINLKKQWLIVARWCLWSGMSITLLTILAGFYAYNTVVHDAPSHAAMTEHRNWALATVTAFLLLTLWSIWLHFRERSPDIAFVIFALLSSGLLASTGWHGSEAVYRYGLGVMSLPDTVGEGHTHEHEVVDSGESENKQTPQQPPKPPHEEQHAH
jgi:uncharacterized membrane protein